MMCFDYNQTSVVLDDLLKMVALYDGKDSQFAAGVKAMYTRIFSSLGIRYELNDTSVVLRDSDGKVFLAVPR